MAFAILATAAHADEATFGAAAAASGRYFGAAIDVNALDERPYRTLMGKQLTSATPENAMKWGEVERQRGEFDWSAADAFVAFAKAHGLKIRGHTLVWHSQLPRWLITGKLFTRRGEGADAGAHRDRGFALQRIDLRLGRRQRTVDGRRRLASSRSSTTRWGRTIFRLR